MFYYLPFYRHLPARTGLLPKIPELPPFIGQLPTRGIPKGCALPAEGRVYAVSFTSICHPTGRLRYTDPVELRKALRLPPGSRLALIGTASDKLLERFWERSEILSSWKTLAALQFDFATSLSFSVWEEDPRFDQLFNQDRNRATFEILTSLGIPTIPFIFVALEDDIYQWKEWLDERPAIGRVALLAQFYRSPERFRAFLNLAQQLRRALRRHINFIVVGCATPEKLRSLFRGLPESTVVTGTPVIRGIRGRGVSPRLRFSYLPLVERSVLIRGNLLEYEEFCGGLEQAA